MKQLHHNTCMTKEEQKRAGARWGAVCGLSFGVTMLAARFAIVGWLAQQGVQPDSPEYLAWMTTGIGCALLAMLLVLNAVRVLFARLIVKAWICSGPTPSLWYLAVCIISVGYGILCWRLGDGVEFVAPASLYNTLVGAMFGIAATMLFLLPVSFFERPTSTNSAPQMTPPAQGIVQA